MQWPLVSWRDLLTPLVIALSALVWGAGCSGPDHDGGAGPARLDRTGLEEIEDLSESLANDLLALSVEARRLDVSAMAAHFAPELRATPLPASPPPLAPAVKWIQARDWQPAPVVDGLDRIAFMNSWAAFLDHFNLVEDVRFKVKSATLAHEAAGAEGTVLGAGTARIKFFLVGRDERDRREWVRGIATITARQRSAERWQIESFEIETLGSLVAERDLFAEVAGPAGVAATEPAYGTAENGGYAWRGAAAGDVDGDGRQDLCVVGLEALHLYRNRGDGTFENIAEEVGLFTLERATAPLFIDVDHDGDSDLFLAAVGHQLLFENRLIPDGKLAFHDVSVQAGVSVPAVGFSAVASDLNGDARPDIYVACYNRYGQVMPDAWDRATNGTPNLLFLSEVDAASGATRYAEAGARLGVDDTRWSYAAGFADVDGDGDADLYVANDYGENGLYLNEMVARGDGSGAFRDAAAERGVLDPGNGMGVSFGDIDNDGDLDLHVTNMSSTAGNRILGRLTTDEVSDHDVLRKLASGNSLYENLGDGHFRPALADATTLSAGWAWGGGFIDLDNDGWEDLYTPNGFISGKSMKDT